MTIMASANFSDLLQRPRETLANLREGRHIRLRRRGDEEDLVVTTASRHQQEHEVVVLAARIFRHLADWDSDAAVRLFVQVFPWVRFLPPADADEFLTEFVDVLHASADLDTFVPVWQVVVEWKHTAEVHADPELLATLRSEGEDFGPVPEPTVSG